MKDNIDMVDVLDSDTDNTDDHDNGNDDTTKTILVKKKYSKKTKIVLLG